MIDVLISTYGEGIKKAVNVPLPKREGVRYIISHQSMLPPDAAVSEIINSRDDISYYQLHNKGLSRNRNNTIAQSSSKFIYFCDDDVVLKKSIFDTIFTSFEMFDVDAISFKIEAFDFKPFKNYKREIFKHTIISSLKVSSIELVCKRASIVDNNIKFDEDFGLGSKYIASEENIFVSDIIKAGLTVLFVPDYIVFHSAESSGKNWASSELVYSKGAFFKRVFGPYVGYVFIFLFALKKYKQYRYDRTFIDFVQKSLLGYKEYK